jgi:hypothetical protein
MPGNQQILMAPTGCIMRISVDWIVCRAGFRPLFCGEAPNGAQ